MTTIVNVNAFHTDEFSSYFDYTEKIENYRKTKILRSKINQNEQNTKPKMIHEEIFEISNVNEDEFLKVFNYNCENEKNFNITQSIEELLKYFDEDVSLEIKTKNKNKNNSDFCIDRNDINKIRPDNNLHKNKSKDKHQSCKKDDDDDDKQKVNNNMMKEENFINKNSTDIELPKSYIQIRDYFKNMTKSADKKYKLIDIKKNELNNEQRRNNLKTVDIDAKETFNNNAMKKIDYEITKPIPSIRHSLLMDEESMINNDCPQKVIFTPPRPKPRNLVLKCATKLFKNVTNEDDLSMLSVKDKIALFNELMHPYNPVQCKKQIEQRQILQYGSNTEINNRKIIDENENINENNINEMILPNEEITNDKNIQEFHTPVQKDPINVVKTDINSVAVSLNVNDKKSPKRSNNCDDDDDDGGGVDDGKLFQTNRSWNIKHRKYKISKNKHHQKFIDLQSITNLSMKRKNAEIGTTLLVDIFAPPKKIRRAHMSKRFLQIYYFERCKMQKKKENEKFDISIDSNEKLKTENDNTTTVTFQVEKTKNNSNKNNTRKLSELYIQLFNEEDNNCQLSSSEQKISTELKENEYTIQNIIQIDTNNDTENNKCKDIDRTESIYATKIKDLYSKDFKDKLYITPKMFERAYSLTTLSSSSPQSPFNSLKRRSLSTASTIENTSNDTFYINSRISSCEPQISIEYNTQKCEKNSLISPGTEKFDKCKLNSSIKNKSMHDINDDMNNSNKLECSTPIRTEKISDNNVSEKTLYKSLYSNVQENSDINEKIDNLQHTPRSLITTNGFYTSMNTTNPKKYSKLWFSMKNCKIIINIFFNTSERLKYFYDLFQAETFMTDELEFGIDNYKFSKDPKTEMINDVSKMWPKLPGYSHYWFANNHITIPFDGEFMNVQKIRNLFAFIRNTLDNSINSEFKFGVDDLEFSTSILPRRDDDQIQIQKTLEDRYFSILNESATDKYPLMHQKTQVINKSKFQPPENELKKSHDSTAALSEHQLRVQASLQRLNIPDWFRQYSPSQQKLNDSTSTSVTYKPGSFTRKRASDSGRWAGLNSKTTSLSSLGSQRSDQRSPLLLSPSAHSHHGGGGGGGGGQITGFSRWSTSHLNSTQTSPSVSTRGSFSRGNIINSSFISGHSFNSSGGGTSIRNSFRQPYLGWRSQEKLTSPRTPHERLASSLLSQKPPKPEPAVTPEIQTSIKEVTSAIVHYVNDQTNRTSRSRSTSPNSRKCWLESSFVGIRPVESPQTPTLDNSNCSFNAVTPTSLSSASTVSAVAAAITSSGIINQNQNLIRMNGVGATTRPLPTLAIGPERSPSSASLEDVLASLLGLPTDSYRSTGMNLRFS